MGREPETTGSLLEPPRQWQRKYATEIKTNRAPSHFFQHMDGQYCAPHPFVQFDPTFCRQAAPGLIRGAPRPVISRPILKGLGREAPALGVVVLAYAAVNADPAREVVVEGGP